MSSSIAPRLLADVGGVIRERLGLHFPPERSRDLEAALHVVADTFGCEDAETCARKISGEPLDTEDLKTLAQALTVGETNFYRDPEVFKVLERDILPPLIDARRDGDRRIRVWSAGCCTGEEPYTIAMILARALPDIDDWNVTLLATDVNPDFLAKAERGIYGKWSFRRTPQWMWRRHFTALEKGRFEIDARIRSMVTFEHLNLAEDVYPSVFNNTNAMDIVFCRNVLIYFDQPTVERVVARLRSSLLADGWLALGRSERVPESIGELEAVTLRDDVWYRRIDGVVAGEESGEAAGDPAGAASAAPFPSDLQGLFDRGEYSTVAREVPHYLETGNLSRSDRRRAMRIQAQACANLGRLDEAQGWCEEALSEDRLDPRLHYLLASVLLERNRATEAEESFQRALFADDRFVLAHFALGNLNRRQRAPERARQHYQRTLALLRHYRPDEILPDSEGMTAGRLSQITEQALSQC